MRSTAPLRTQGASTGAGAPPRPSVLRAYNVGIFEGVLQVSRRLWSIRQLARPDWGVIRDPKVKHITLTKMEGFPSIGSLIRYCPFAERTIHNEISVTHSNKPEAQTPASKQCRPTDWCCATDYTTVGGGWAIARA